MSDTHLVNTCFGPIKHQKRTCASLCVPAAASEYACGSARCCVGCDDG